MALTYPSVTDNRIINGDFLIDQRHEFGTSAPVTTAYVTDMWKLETTGLGGDLQFQVQSTNLLFGPDTTQNCIGITVISSAAPSTAQCAAISQPIEGIKVGDLLLGWDSAQSINISFRARASLTGFYCVSLRNSATNRSYVFSYGITVANRWTDFTFVVPGDITGTWLNSAGTVGLRLSFDLGCGTTFQTSQNAWGAGNFYSASGTIALVANTAATLYISRVVLRAGPIIDSQPYFPREFSQEMLACRRWYQKTFQPGTAPAQNAGITGAITVKNPIALGDPSEWWQFTPPMAATPTIITYNPSAGNANWRDITAGADSTVSVDPASTKGASGVLIATSGTVTTLGDILAIHATADAGL